MQGLKSDFYTSDYVTNDRFRSIHPMLVDNGNLFIKDHYSPSAMVDWCRHVVWRAERIHHHATELDSDGNIWVPGVQAPQNVRYTKSGSFDDQIVQLSPAGDVLNSWSIAEILIDNGYDWLVGGMRIYEDVDPLHLNDIQPVLQDGKFWKKGDLFLSIRRRSTIFQFRPSTGRIVWLQTGPWYYQHDVDIL